MKIPPSVWLTPQPVDGYDRPFGVLVSQRLPKLFTMLEKQMRRPLPLELFDRDGCGPKALSDDGQFKAHFADVKADFDLACAYTAERQKDKSQKNDFAGVYVFLTNGLSVEPFYVGITQTVLRRLRGHLRSRNHNAATFLFQLVRSLETGTPKRRVDVNLKSKRAQAVLDWLRAQRVAILPLALPVERYAFELYASMNLRTGRWNSFETH
jgi:hypothetical protein